MAVSTNYFFIRIVLTTLILFTGISAAYGDDLFKLNYLNMNELNKQISRFENQIKEDPSNITAKKGLGISFHIKATADTEEYAERAASKLENAYSYNKKDYEVMVYFGSATTMLATTTWNPMKKMSYVNKGTALMDKAVRRAPENITVRMTRGLNSMNLPSLFKRRALALEDFEYLAEQIKKKPELKIIAKSVYSNLVKLYKENKEEEKSAYYTELLNK